MKILIVNASDIGGGAARATYRLHQSLLTQNIDSQMLVQNKQTNDVTIIGATTKLRQLIINPCRPALDHILMKIFGVKMLFSSSYLPFSEIIKQINKLNPDIVHLHWITGGMMRIEDLAKIKAPIVWSLHDNWAFTGGCHIMWECDKYKNSCGACPRLGSIKENDLSKKIWHRKKKIFEKLNNLTIVGLSLWINQCSKESALLRDKKHINLPNPINTTIFKPINKKQSRDLYNLSQDKQLVLFGAMGATSDTNKGFKKLTQALKKLKTKNIELIVFGSSKPKEPIDFNFKVHYVGTLHDDISLVTLYSAVDVMVVPSLQENLSNAIMESLSCGTPVVGFKIGGNSDMIVHKKTGYLAKPFDTNDLAQGIDWVLNEDRQMLLKNARDKVLSDFDSKIVAKKYIKLYQEILNK